MYDFLLINDFLLLFISTKENIILKSSQLSFTKYWQYRFSPMLKKVSDKNRNLGGKPKFKPGKSNSSQFCRVLVQL